MAGAMCGRGACMVRGVHGMGGICGRGMHSRGHAWWEGGCVAGETATPAEGVYPTGMYSRCE